MRLKHKEILVLAIVSLSISSCKKDSNDTLSNPSGGTPTAPGAGCSGSSTVTDIDGNTYATVQIGAQCWMAANLRTTRYRDGSAIPNVTVNTTWVNLTTGAWCNYDNNPDLNTPHGKLYNWHAATDSRGICPEGWHLPTDTEWQQLESTMGMLAGELNDVGYRGTTQNVGGKMKANTLWEAPNAGATNSSGFSGLPSGAINNSGNFLDAFGTDGFWWSGSEDNTGSNAWQRSLRYTNSGIKRDYYPKNGGFCVRCIRE